MTPERLAGRGEVFQVFRVALIPVGAVPFGTMRAVGASSVPGRAGFAHPYRDRDLWQPRHGFGLLTVIDGPPAGAGLRAVQRGPPAAGTVVDFGELDHGITRAQ